MGIFLFNFLLWTLAIYGAIEIIKNLIHTYYRPKFATNGVYLFIAVKNQENKIEGFLRSLLFRIIYGKEENINNIFVVDLNSTDKTANILEFLSKDYDCIKHVDIKTCEGIIESIAQKK